MWVCGQMAVLLGQHYTNQSGGLGSCLLNCTYHVIIMVCRPLNLAVGHLMKKMEKIAVCLISIANSNDIL